MPEESVPKDLSSAGIRLRGILGRWATGARSTTNVDDDRILLWSGGHVHDKQQYRKLVGIRKRLPRMENTEMSTLAIRLLVYVIMGVVGFGSVVYIRGVIRDNAELRKAQLEMIQRVSKAEENLSRLDKLSSDRFEGQRSIRSETSAIQNRIQNEATANETSRSYLLTVIPDGVRIAVIGDASPASPADSGAGGADNN